MSKLVISSDLHLGHKNVLKFRPEFASDEAHNETIFDRLCWSVNKADSLYLLGDVAFDKYWLGKIGEIKCRKKTLILGNHDTDQKLKITDLASVFNEIHSLHSRRNCWFSHCPIHPGEFRGKILNIHGHLHRKVIDDPRYVNVCVDNNNYYPVTFADLV